MIDGQTQIYGVIGYPLGHTLSPAMHNAAFKANGLNAVYLSFETRDLPGPWPGCGLWESGDERHYSP